MIHSTFNNILDFIPDDVNIFLNDTKVIKARIFGEKESGGKIELLLNKPHINDTFMVFIKGRIKNGTILKFDNGLFCEVLDICEDGSRIVWFWQNINDNNENKKRLNFEELIVVLNKIGHIPLPHYLNREDEKADELDYQTLFAKNYGAVAAPTASLHFTPQTFKALEDKFNIFYLTLHVGAGTFKPVDVEDILAHPMHSEYFSIPDNAKDTILENNKILAVGTTVTRTIEFFKKTNQQNGEANIFLNPLNPPQRVDYLLTNFHLPKSTLIMLVASFVGLSETLRIYDEAIKNHYRFFSYGDGMLII
ncbi:MAG: tRNA preQ1(34) S-adenosylmethionine ribosyltransferase-isomerase QueA [Arcobacter sp.]|nr:tRNA preQ1(34) S-adenosylmethionine ribosyltransferase-isomerase QueA [Arcobacter sp.]